MAANEAYSDIVRYGNVRYAMLQHLRNPPKDFEQAIRLHFSLRKADILALCEVFISSLCSEAGLQACAKATCQVGKHCSGLPVQLTLLMCHAPDMHTEQCCSKALLGSFDIPFPSLNLRVSIFFQSSDFFKALTCTVMDFNRTHGRGGPRWLVSGFFSL